MNCEKNIALTIVQANFSTSMIIFGSKSRLFSSLNIVTKRRKYRSCIQLVISGRLKINSVICEFVMFIITFIAIIFFPLSKLLKFDLNSSLNNSFYTVRTFFSKRYRLAKMGLRCILTQDKEIANKLHGGSTNT